jgi:hypothetical protein
MTTVRMAECYLAMSLLSACTTGNSDEPPVNGFAGCREPPTNELAIGAGKMVS